MLNVRPIDHLRRYSECACRSSPSSTWLRVLEVSVSYQCMILNSTHWTVKFLATFHDINSAHECASFSRCHRRHRSFVVHCRLSSCRSFGSSIIATDLRWRPSTRHFSCKDGPISSLMTLRSTTPSPMLGLINAAMVVITFFAPGAIKPEATSIAHSCEVSTVDLGNASVAILDREGTGKLTYLNPIAQLRLFVNQVLLSGTYLSRSRPVWGKC